MRQNRLRILIVLAAVAVSAGIFFSNLKAERAGVLHIKNAEGSLLASLPLPDGRFDHVFIHSIHLTPVEECFVLAKAADNEVVLRLFELRYQSSGVGMPSDAEGGYRLENGVFILSMHREYRTIPVMVSTVEGHGVRIGDTLYPFRTWTDSEDRIELSARMVRRIQFKR